MSRRYRQGRCRASARVVIRAWWDGEEEERRRWEGSRAPKINCGNWHSRKETCLGWRRRFGRCRRMRRGACEEGAAAIATRIDLRRRKEGMRELGAAEGRGRSWRLRVRGRRRRVSLVEVVMEGDRDCRADLRRGGVRMVQGVIDRFLLGELVWSMGRESLCLVSYIAWRSGEAI